MAQQSGNGETPTASSAVAGGLKIRRFGVYSGPNLWAYKPVCHLELDLGDFERSPSDTLEGFCDALLAAIPSLERHKCTLGTPGGFVKRLRQGTWLGHVVEHVALELQALAGNDVKFGKTRATETAGVYHVLYEFMEEAVGIEAGRIAVELCDALARGQKFDLEPRVEALTVMVDDLAYGPSTLSILREARKRGIPTIRLSEANLVQLGYGRWQQRIQATTTSLTRTIAVDIACDKHLTKQLLADIGVPVPLGVLVDSVEAALDEAATMGYPVVVKPLDFSHGRGISLDIRDPQHLAKAFSEAQEFTRDVIVERFLQGRDYRILVVNGEVVAVAERVPAHVVGDGIHSIAELVEILNHDPRRGIGHEKVLTRIVIDEQTRHLLAQQRYDLDTVPPDGQMVLLKATANISTGGTAIDRTDEIHFANLEMAVRVARAIGLDIAGIDVITPDIARPVTETGGGIVEVNAAPGFRMHVAPSEGPARDVAGPVVDMLFPRGTPSRIPVISITGTNGKTTTARITAHIMKMGGHKVGLTTTDGIYIDGTLIRRGDMTGPWSARMVCKDPTVDCAVLETARGGILRSGLGFERCEVGAVLNIANDHLGLGGINSLEEMAHVKALVVDVVLPTGWAVLNAEDPRCAAMATRCDGKVAWFSIDRKNETFRKHIDSEATGATIDRGWLVIHDGRKRIPVVEVVDIPATYGGVSNANIKNALAAALICHVCGVRVEDIRQGLQTFDASYYLTPGRLNMIDVRDFRVLLDYAHNVAAYEEMARFVSVFNRRRAVGLIGAPGDRQDENLRRMGEVAGACFDRVVIKEDDDLRGRASGEVARLMEEGARTGRKTSGRMPEADVEIVLSEEEAVDRVLQEAGTDDLVVILAENLTRTWDQVMRFRTRGGDAAGAVAASGAHVAALRHG